MCDCDSVLNATAVDFISFPFSIFSFGKFSFLEFKIYHIGWGVITSIAVALYSIDL